MKSTALTILTLVTFLSYGQHSNYRPENLHKVSDDTLITRVAKRLFPNLDEVIIKDTLGNQITKEEAEKIDYNRFFADYYADNKGKIREVVFRKITPGDRELLKKLAKAFEDGEKIPLIEVNCNEVKDILEKVLDIDQQNRAEGKQINYGIDRDNQIKVISIIEKCGWPTKKEVGEKGMESVFLVIQHASKKIRATYFPFIKQSAENGDLKLSGVALMEDRMLMENGLKQKYGSQLVRTGDGPLTLYPIEDPVNVNKRRAEMGLETIEDYLKHFGLEYEP